MWSLFVGFEKTSQYKMEKLHFLCSLHSTKLSFLQKTVRRMNVANKYKNMKNSWTKHFALVIRLVASSNVITLLILLCIMLRNSKDVLKISWCSFFKERGIVKLPTNHVEGRKVQLLLTQENYQESTNSLIRPYVGCRDAGSGKSNRIIGKELVWRCK